MFSFVHPGFVIAGLAAAALPIVIHLLLRQRARMLPIGSVRFLKSVIRQHTRRRKIRQWIVLAMRVLAVLLLALLFARPFLDRSAVEGQNREVAVLVDRSASMQATGGATRETAFATAMDLARRVVAELDENTAVHVALFDARGVAELELDELDEQRRAGDAATDYGLALSWARDVMTVSTRPQRRVVLITDLQQSGLHRTQLEDFPGGVDLSIRDVGRAMSRNVAVEDCQAVVTEIRPKEPVRVRVRLLNAGALPVKNLGVSLQLRGPRGKIARQQRITIAGGMRDTVDFILEEIQTDGVYAGQVSIEHLDDLAFDNGRWLAFEARHPDRLLLVDGQQGRSVYTNETYYLETALRLRTATAASGIRSFEVERIVWEDGEGFPSLAGFRAIVIANIRRLSDVDARRLRDYVNSGGNLLFFCGDQTRPALVAKLSELGLFAGTMNREPARGPWRIDAWEKQHPALLPFQDPQQGDLRSLSFDRVVEVVDLGEAARVLISAAEMPILVETSLGRGTALCFTTTADRAWSNWPQSRLYVPLVRQMMAYLTDQLTGRQRVVSRLVGDKTVQAGVFRDGERTVVRNIDPQESLLERVSDAEFRRAYSLAEREDEIVLAELAATIDPPAGVQRPNESWDTVAWMLLAVLTMEIFLASRVHA